MCDEAFGNKTLGGINPLYMKNVSTACQIGHFSIYYFDN